MSLPDEYIIRQIGKADKKQFESQFSLEDFTGKTIVEHRKIKNPKPYDPEVASPNPENFDVLVFSDNTFLVTECWGDGECGHLNYYYYNGNKTLYSDRLFGIL
jgi:hypothetical protein